MHVKGIVAGGFTGALTIDALQTLLEHGVSDFVHCKQVAISEPG